MDTWLTTRTTPTRLFALLSVAWLSACGDSPDPVEPSLPAEARQADVPTSSAQTGPNDWIVVFRPGVADPPGLARALVEQSGGSLRFVYEHTIQGFAATLPPQALPGLRNNPNVDRIEPDGVVTAVTEEPAASWGLDRIDQRSSSLDQTYHYVTDGAGVDAYIIDTGIRTTHNDFGGRAWRGSEADFIGGSGDDCHGHGTHVAGIVGGATYGVAKAVDLLAVRVLDCNGEGALSGVIAGVDWVTGEHVDGGGPSVANMSLSVWDPFGWYDAINTAVAASVDKGVVYAVAASNDDDNACDYKPASSPWALTVGATDSSDRRASFSNYGFCVDIFAPGVGITSAYASGDDATRVWSGTSMASPHVAGVAALYLGENPSANPPTVEYNIKTNTTDGVIVDPGPDSPNKLLYSLITDPPPSSPPAAPSGLTATAASASRIDLQWTDNSGDESGFSIERSTDGVSFAPLDQVGENVTGFADTGLASKETYWYRVRADNEAGSSTWAGPVSAETHSPPPVPDPPSNLQAEALSHDQIELTWSDVELEDGYSVERWNGSAWTVISTVGADVTDHLDGGLPASTAQTYRVSAFNTTGSSDYSPTATATTLAAPAGTDAEVWEISDVDMYRDGKYRYGNVLATVRVAGTEPPTLLTGVTVEGDWWRDGDTAPFDSSTGVTSVLGVYFESIGVKGGAQMYFCVTTISGDIVDRTTYPACSQGFTPPTDPGEDPVGGVPSGLSVKWEPKKGGGRMELSWTPGGGGDVSIYRTRAGATTAIAVASDNGGYNDRGGEPTDEYQVCVVNEGPDDGTNCTERAGASGS